MTDLQFLTNNVDIKALIINQNIMSFHHVGDGIVLDFVNGKPKEASKYNVNVVTNSVIKAEEIALLKKVDNEIKLDTNSMYICDELKQQATQFEQVFQNQQKMTFKQIGQAQDNQALVIALHGGGSAPKELNDSQYDHMKVYYNQMFLKYNLGFNFAYIALRGVRDTWDLHCQPEHEDLLRNIILYCSVHKQVSPNRIIITGFSAGGDGCHFLGSYLPDLFCFINASAGHHNGCSLLQRSATISMYQVGEYDIAYKRNEVNLKRGAIQQLLNECFGQLSYSSTTFIHKECGHNFVDYGAQSRVYLNPSLIESDIFDEQLSEANICTQPVIYGLQTKRQIIPSLVVFDCKTKFMNKKVKFLYNCYLISDYSITVFIERKDQNYNIASVGNGTFRLGIMLKEQEQFKIIVNNKDLGTSIASKNPYQQLSVMQRLDPTWDFDYVIEVNYE
uniref:Alpha/beta hydrolase family protein n=1 Tax=Trepomonas sp. PC1 TaxID=1076344 RepID=A0A146KKF7_9EUKA|eukprot:JAP95911.1 Hypothetical protein TPC1_10936 [Trepomonas sp. PC1]